MFGLGRKSKHKERLSFTPAGRAYYVKLRDEYKILHPIAMGHNSISEISGIIRDDALVIQRKVKRLKGKGIIL